MTQKPNRTSSLLWDLAVYVGGGGAISAVEAAVAPPRQSNSPIAPPAPVIGAVWSALFTAYAVARSRLTGARAERRMVDGLWLLCVTYPLYTDGIRDRRAALVGNALVAAAASGVAWRISRLDRLAADLILPTLPWVAATTLALLTEQPTLRDRARSVATNLRPAPRRRARG